MSRRIRQRMTWDYWKTLLATIVWVAPLTLLIWGVAEREQIVSGESTVRLDPRSQDTTLSIRMPGRSTDSVQLTFEGPRVGVSAVNEFLLETSREGGLVFSVSDALPVGEVSTIDLRQALQDERVFSENGVRIVATSPATADVFVDKIVTQVWPVLAETGIDPNLIITFEPTGATVVGPQRVLEQSSQRLYVEFPDNALTDVGTEPRLLDELSIVLPDDVAIPLTIDPQRVDATVRRKATVLENYVIRTMIIRVAKPAAVEGQLRIKVDPFVLNNIEVTGPPEMIARLERGEVQGVAVLDVPGNVLPGQRRATLRIELPNGVRLVDEPPAIDYEVTAVSP
ncbi:MAG: hypothetical protein AAGD32_06580 [Planctomycetota bacterium]